MTPTQKGRSSSIHIHFDQNDLLLLHSSEKKQIQHSASTSEDLIYHIVVLINIYESEWIFPRQNLKIVFSTFQNILNKNLFSSVNFFSSPIPIYCVGIL